VAALVVLALIAGGIALAVANSDDDDTTSDTTAAPTSSPARSSAVTVTSVPSATETPTTETPTTEVATTTEPTTTEASATAPPNTTEPSTTTTTPPGPPTTTPLPEFFNGTHAVGTDIQPGRYRSAGGAVCSFARLRNLSGDPTGTIASGTAVGQSIVDIAPTDAAFRSAGCAPWIAFIAATPVKTFGDGDWAIGVHFPAGRYRAPGGAGCRWARVRDFSHEPSGTIAQGTPTGAVTVTIASTDVGFETAHCGTWRPTA
jgi:hypothetical protein